MAQRYQDTPNQPPKAGLIGYAITNQVETQELDANGRSVRGVRVTYKLNQTGAQGQPITGSVFVPESMVTVANVQAAVAAAAGVKAQIQQLSG